MIGPTDYAWAAGFIDGEGYLCVARKNPTYGVRASGPRVGRPRRDGTSYSLCLTVVNRNPAPMYRLAELFGGSVITRTRANKSSMYFWRIGHANALSALEAVVPFLIGKKDLATLCISFQQWWGATKGENGRSMTDERRHKAHFYYLECRRLIARYNESAQKALLTSADSTPFSGERQVVPRVVNAV